MDALTHISGRPEDPETHRGSNMAAVRKHSHELSVADVPAYLSDGPSAPFGPESPVLGAVAGSINHQDED